MSIADNSYNASLPLVIRPYQSDDVLSLVVRLCCLSSIIEPGSSKKHLVHNFLRIWRSSPQDVAVHLFYCASFCLFTAIMNLLNIMNVE